MISLIFLYILGAIITSNIVAIWNLTNMPVYLTNLFFRTKFITRDDWEKYLLINCGKFGELLLCPLCFSTHVSWMIYFLAYIFVEIPVWGFLPCMFSWPVISYSIFNKIK